MNTQALINRTETNSVPNFGAIAFLNGAKVYSTSMEAGERRDEIKAELKHDMSRALSGLQPFVPSWHRSHLGAGCREKLSSAAEETMAALDHMECCEKLMLVLANSECPLVAELRKAVIDRYVCETVDGVFEARRY